MSRDPKPLDSAPPKPECGLYTCTDYREEMILLGLRRQLQRPSLDETQRSRLLEAIRKIESRMGMD